MAKKYIDAEKLSKAIEEKGLDCSFALKMERLDTLALIDELKQEQPEVDLKNEIITQWSKCNPIDEGMGSEYAIITVEQFDAIALHFYELGRLNVRKEEQ